MSQRAQDIYDAVNRGDVASLKTLLHGASKDDLRYEKKDTTYKTALMYAAWMERPEICRMLIDAGSDVNQKEEEYHRTPLIWAARGGNLEVVEMMLAAGADPHACETDGITALYFAAEYGHVKIVERLLRTGVDINAHRRNGHTPLMMAVQRDRIDCIRMLVQAGADRTRKDRYGLTAMDMAKSDAARALLGADVDDKEKSKPVETALPQTPAPPPAPPAPPAPHQSAAPLPPTPPNPSSTTSTAANKSPAIHSAADVAASEISALEVQSERFLQDLARSTARTSVVTSLQATFSAADSADTDIELILTLGTVLDSISSLPATPQLSEEDSQALCEQYEALLTAIAAKCREMRAVRKFSAVKTLASQLVALQALDLSALSPAWMSDPVYVEE